jgi:hypothetical protein
MGRACGTQEMVQLLAGKCKRKRPFGNLSVDGSIKLKWILKKGWEDMGCQPCCTNSACAANCTRNRSVGEVAAWARRQIKGLWARLDCRVRRSVRGVCGGSVG